MNPKVDAYVVRSERWAKEMTLLRAVLRRCDLTEEVKWGKPCYSHNGANIVIIQEMKDFLALMFFKGALLDDPVGVLEAQGPNSRSALRIRFTSAEDVRRLATTVEAYVGEAIAVAEASREIGPTPELVFVEELQIRLDQDPLFKAAFDALTPGRKREYNLYFSDAKQAATRAARVEKCAPRILDGKGFRDR